MGEEPGLELATKGALVYGKTCQERNPANLSVSR